MKNFILLLLTIVLVWSVGVTFFYWIINPQHTEMQVFLKMPEIVTLEAFKEDRK